VAWTPVNSWTLWQTTGGGTPQSASAPTTVAGNTIFVGVSIFTNTVSVTSVTDVAGNTYVLDKAKNSANASNRGRIEIWRCSNCLGAASNKITVHLSGITNGCDMGAVELSGGDSAGTQDGAGNTAAATSTTPAGGSFSTSGTNGSTLLISAFGDAATGTVANPTVPSSPSAFTAVYTYGNAALFTIGGMAYAIVSGAQTSINPAWSVAASTDWGAVNLAYQAAASATGKLPPPLLLQPQMAI